MSLALPALRRDQSPMPIFDHQDDRQATLEDWTADFASMIQTSWGLSSLETIALADSLTEALADVTLIPRPDALPPPSRIQADLRRSALIDRMADADALSDAIETMGGEAGGPNVSGEALATIFVEQIRTTYSIAPIAAMGMHRAIASVLRAYGIDARPIAVLTKPLERDLGQPITSWRPYADNS